MSIKKPWTNVPIPWTLDKSSNPWTIQGNPGRLEGLDSWSSAYSENGIFGGDPRGISFAICTDGVNPFAHNKVAYSLVKFATYIPKSIC